MSDLMYPNEPELVMSGDEFELFLLWCASIGASDVLLSTKKPLTVKRYQKVIIVGKRPIEHHEIEGIVEHIAQKSTMTQVMSGEPIDFQYTVLRDIDPSKGADFRGCATATRNGCEIVLRTFKAVPPTIDELDLEHEIVSASNPENGLIIVAGTTGSGKSTTVSALLSNIAKTKPLHILTYESPIEYNLNATPGLIANVEQSSVPEHVLTFREGVRNSLRRAPDIIFIGESRDMETIEESVNASEKGPLLYTTMHASSVSQTISRIVNEFPANVRMSMTVKVINNLRLIVYQRLVPKKGGGVVALREFLNFTLELRNRLFDHLDQAESIDLTETIKTMVSRYGQPLIRDAEAKYHEGLIDETNYHSLCLEMGADELIDEERWVVG